MVGYDENDARRYIVSRIDKKAFRSLQGRLDTLIAEMIAYDLHFMRVSGVLDENGCQGENSYDEDEAFEFIYDAWLGDHPNEPDDDMQIAALLNRYRELQDAYMTERGLSDEL